MNTVIYHRSDLDGICCREIAVRNMPDANLIGWDFGDPQIAMPPEDHVFILDLPPDCLQEGFDVSRLIWIDHHKSSIAKWPASIPGYRIDGVAACRLAWQWFAVPTKEPSYRLPSEQAFIGRKVQEPWAVQLIGEYDVWDKRDGAAETFQYALRTVDADWELLLDNDEDYVEDLLDSGSSARAYAERNNAEICQGRTWLMKWEGLTFLCVNMARFNSSFFAARDLPETGHDALLGFFYNGAKWVVSLYHAKHRTDLDLSTIAVKYGGGGHRGACGFTCTSLPPFFQTP